MPYHEGRVSSTRTAWLLPGGVLLWLAIVVCPGTTTAQEILVRLPPLTEPEILPSPSTASTWPENCGPSFGKEPASPSQDEPWTWQVMPSGLLYRSYLAGAKEPRFASYWSTDKDLGAIWDTSVGGRLGLVRYGTTDPVYAEGWQVDLEGGAQARLDPNGESTPLLAADFRVGVPVTWAGDRWQFKTGYYHISSHLGDEYLLLVPDARRINYVRDALCLAVGYYCTERLRLYTETAYAVGADGGAEPWEFQFGADWAPVGDTRLHGAPFVALNGHLREEVAFGGSFVVQAGWAWRRFARGSLFRIGLEYFNGMSDQYEFFDQAEQRIGWGLWADF